MRYDFNCREHGIFEVQQPILEEHKADCPQCGEEAQRIYSALEVIWGGSLYRPDGSRREHDDYAQVMGG